MSAPSTRPGIAHMVYFTLKDPSPAAQDKLVADCHKYLKVAPGILYFAAGPARARPDPGCERD